jgi:hypothetical protein
MKLVRLAALCAASTIATTAHAQTAMSPQCTEILNRLNAKAAGGPATMPTGQPVPPAPWTAPVVGAPSTPTTPGTETPTPTPTTPGTVFGPNVPVVQPLPTPDPTPTPTPTLPDLPVLPTTPPSTGGGSVGYMKSPSISKMTVTSSVHDGHTVQYYRSGRDSSYQQNLTAVKTYPTPSGGSGTKLVTIGGQKILTAGDQKITGLDQHIVNIIDELNLSTIAMGFPDPIITAGHDTAGHSPTSLHYQGDALDLRCNVNNGMSPTQCKQWVVSLASALGPGYDVIFEDWGDANRHVHIGWKG